MDDKVNLDPDLCSLGSDGLYNCLFLRFFKLADLLFERCFILVNCCLVL